MNLIQPYGHSPVVHTKGSYVGQINTREEVRKSNKSLDREIAYLEKQEAKFFALYGAKDLEDLRNKIEKIMDTKMKKQIELLNNFSSDNIQEALAAIGGEYRESDEKTQVYIDLEMKQDIPTFIVDYKSGDGTKGQSRIDFSNFMGWDKKAFDHFTKTLKENAEKELEEEGEKGRKGLIFTGVKKMGSSLFIELARRVIGDSDGFITVNPDLFHDPAKGTKAPLKTSFVLENTSNDFYGITNTRNLRTAKEQFEKYKDSSEFIRYKNRVKRIIKALLGNDNELWAIAEKLLNEDFSNPSTALTYLRQGQYWTSLKRGLGELADRVILQFLFEKLSTASPINTLCLELIANQTNAKGLKSAVDSRLTNNKDTWGIQSKNYSISSLNKFGIRRESQLKNMFTSSGYGVALQSYIANCAFLDANETLDIDDLNTLLNDDKELIAETLSLALKGNREGINFYIVSGVYMVPASEILKGMVNQKVKIKSSYDRLPREAIVEEDPGHWHDPFWRRTANIVTAGKKTISKTRSWAPKEANIVEYAEVLDSIKLTATITIKGNLERFRMLDFRLLPKILTGKKTE